MPQRINVPGHGPVDFPDTMSPDDIRAALVTLSQQLPTQPISAEDFTGQPQQPEGSATGRFLSNAATQLNPLSMASGMYTSVRHPMETAKAIFDASAEQWAKAKDMADQGRYVEAVGHLGGMIPLIGPAAANTGEQIGRGDVAGGLGAATGMLAPSLLAGGTAGLAKGAQVLPDATRAAAAESLEAGAANRVANVMRPELGANKYRFGNTAADVAPDLTKSPGMLNVWSREGLQANVLKGLQTSQDALDAASDARLEGRALPTQPIINDLMAKRAKLTMNAPEASAFPPDQTMTRGTGANVNTIGAQTSAQPYGQNVVPAPNNPRVAMIDQAIAELKAHGPTTRYEELRKMRQSYDGPASVVYSPSVTQDFLAKHGEATGAADVTGSLRDYLGNADPQTAAANAQYSLHKAASDVLAATEEVQRSRPQVGRRIMTQLAGSIGGGAMAGAPGAVVGYVLAPAMQAAIDGGLTSKLQTSRAMSALADAIRTGNTGAAVGYSSMLKRLGVTANIALGQQAPQQQEQK